MYLYNNCEQGIGCYPRLKEISPNGTLVKDTSFLSTMNLYNYDLYDFNNFMQKKDYCK